MSSETALIYHDSRALLRHDGRTFLCGNCACGEAGTWLHKPVQLELEFV